MLQNPSKTSQNGIHFVEHVDDLSSVPLTKLTKPSLGSQLLNRQALSDRLATAPSGSVTLVCAPAGYGKSTAVSLWLETVSAPFIWLSLEEQDSPLWVFVTELIAALRTVHPVAGNATLARIRGQGTPRAERLSTVFLADLQKVEGPLVVVLDDYETIRDEETHAFMSRVCEYSPAHVRFVVISRTEPPIGIARLRARNRLLELRPSDLRFSTDDARELMYCLTGERLSDDTIDLLAGRTEGWAVGLRLLGLAWQGRKDLEDTLASVAGVGQSTTAQYLMEEVLETLTEQQQGVLLRASILDRFCGSLCDALDGTPEASGQGRAILEYAWKSGLFLVGLDTDGIWYRFHHLFGGALRRRLELTLSPESIAVLHGRASVWFENEGLVDEAIFHALAAQDGIRAGSTGRSQYKSFPQPRRVAIA